MMVSCQYSFLCWLQLASHVIEIQEIGFKKFGTELRRGRIFFFFFGRGSGTGSPKGWKINDRIAPILVAYT